MLNDYKNFIERKDVEKACKKYDIPNYTIRDDFSIDCHLSVSIQRCPYLEKLPVKFNSVNGDFFIRNNALTTLEGCPEHIVNDFMASANEITSFKGGPKTVVNNCEISHNKLTTLEGCPEVGNGLFVGRNELVSLVGCPKHLGRFECNHNNLKSLVGGPETVKHTFDVGHNEIESFEGCPKSVGGDWMMGDNNIKDFKGFPEHYNPKSSMNISNNPVFQIFILFIDIRAIEHLNEWDVIDVGNMSVSYLRIVEVYKALDMQVKSYDYLTDYFNRPDVEYTLTD